MYLLSLELTCFKRHAKFHTDLANGLNVIRGPNWAGKSSILHGVMFALFGVTAIPGKKEDLVTWGHAAKDLQVVLKTSNGTITRTLTTASVHQNGELIASGHSSVDLWVTQQFGLDKKTLLELLYSPQSETSAILTLGVPALNRLVEKMSGAALTEQAVQAVRGLTTKAQNQLLALGPEPVLPEVPVEPAENKRGSYRSLLQTLQAHQRDLQQQQQVAAEQARRSRLQAQLAGLVEPERPVDAQNLEVLQAELEAVQAAHLQQARRRELVRWFQTTGAEWETLEANIARKEDLDRQIAEETAKYHELDTQRAELSSQLKGLEQSLADAVCQMCQRPFEEHDPELLKQEMEKARNRWSDQCDQVQLQKKIVWSLTAKRDALKLPPSDYQERYNANAAELESIPDVTPPDPNYLKNQIKLIQAYEVAIAQYEATRKSLLNEIETITAPLKQVDLDELRLEQQNIDQQITNTQRNLEEAVQEWTQYKLRLEERQVSVQRLEEHQAKSKDYSVRVIRLKEFESWLKKFKTEVLINAWDSICATATGFINEASGGRATELTRDDDQFYLTEDGRSVPVAVVSGGMRAIAGTGLKLALSQFGFLLLDEASSELNNENAANLASALSGAERQVLMVTHREGEEYLAAQTIQI